jgi:cyclophilin family peptidyl-prolyl cis-trans isomerase
MAFVAPVPRRVAQAQTPSMRDVSYRTCTSICSAHNQPSAASTASRCISIPVRTVQQPLSVTRRFALALAASALLLPVLPSLATDLPDAAPFSPQELTRTALDATVTDRAYLDVSIGGRQSGRIVIGLFGREAPASVDAFKAVCCSALRNRSGRTVGYPYSQAWRVVRDVRVDMGRVKQVDEINQSSGTPQRQIVLINVPENREVNDLNHNVAGSVSVRRGGGQFEFVITPKDGPNPALDAENIVIGRVLEGMDTVAAMNIVPTNEKTFRDSMRSVGKVIGDGRAKLDLESKPLQKIVIKDSGII